MGYKFSNSVMSDGVWISILNKYNNFSKHLKVRQNTLVCVVYVFSTLFLGVWKYVVKHDISYLICYMKST